MVYFMVWVLVWEIDKYTEADTICLEHATNMKILFVNVNYVQNTCKQHHSKKKISFFTKYD